MTEGKMTVDRMTVDKMTADKMPCCQRRVVTSLAKPD